MALYDSSVLIDYLDGDERMVEYLESHAEERAVTIPLVMFEVYQGEVFTSGTADVSAVDQALRWVTVADDTRHRARVAAELQAQLENRGCTLSARDAYIAGAAKELNERLVVADSDFDVPILAELLDVEFP